jgi:hypothetical protein
MNRGFFFASSSTEPGSKITTVSKFDGCCLSFSCRSLDSCRPLNSLSFVLEHSSPSTQPRLNKGWYTSKQHNIGRGPETSDISRGRPRVVIRTERTAATAMDLVLSRHGRALLPQRHDSQRRPQIFSCPGASVRGETPAPERDCLTIDRASRRSPAVTSARVPGPGHLARQLGCAVRLRSSIYFAFRRNISTGA